MTNSYESNPNDPAPPENPVFAYADGEMDHDENLRYLKHLAEQPEATHAVIHQQELKSACARALAKDCPATPADLADRVRAMLNAQDQDADAPPSLSQSEPQNSPEPVVGRIGFFSSFSNLAPVAAVAAMLIFAVTLYLVNPLQPQSDPGQNLIAGILPVSKIAKFEKRHTTCALSPEALVSITKEGDLDAVPKSLDQIFGTPHTTPSLDLSTLGYTFDRVGKCNVPGKHAAHLIFKGLPDSGHTDTLSLWLIPFDANKPTHEKIANAHLYTLTPPNSDSVMLVWRDAGLVYYLLGNQHDESTVVDAAHTLSGL